MTGKHKVVYDLEQLKNFHSCTALDISTNEIKVFVIHTSRNDIKEYIAYLEQCKIMIGFNNLNYDYPMLHYILLNKQVLINLSPNRINELLYQESQRIINLEYSEIKRDNMFIPQIDLYRVWHFDNKNRRMSSFGDYHSNSGDILRALITK